MAVGKSGVTLTGPWADAARKLATLDERYAAAMRKAVRISAARFERRLVLHIQNQDLPWKPLSKAYRERKLREGYSTDIYIKTSSLQQSITTSVSEDGMTAVVGAKRVAEHNGALVNVVALMEFGSVKAGIPARPLFRPAWAASEEETRQEILKALRVVMGK
ncbi:MAG: hypothetical protein RLY93_20530 [Sumerlaeia bacterium]